MAQWLRALALAEDSGPRAHMVAHNHLKLVSEDLTPTSELSGCQARKLCICIHTGKIYPYRPYA